MTKNKGSFIAWIEKLDEDARVRLFRDLLGYVEIERDRLLNSILATMCMDEKADLIDEIATELHDNHYDWGVFNETGEPRK